MGYLPYKTPREVLLSKFSKEFAQDDYMNDSFSRSAVMSILQGVDVYVVLEWALKERRKLATHVIAMTEAQPPLPRIIEFADPELAKKFVEAFNNLKHL